MSELISTDLINDANLQAYYRFNSGALTTDSSGNSRTLTNNNTVGETAGGKFGYSAHFGDPNTNKYFSRAEDFWNNGAFSVPYWVKRNNTSDTHGFFFASDAGTNKQLYMYATSSNIVGQIFRAGVGYDTVSASITPDTNWHHYALTLTTGAGGTMKIYYDGVELNSGSVTNASGSVGQSNQYFVGKSSGDPVEGYQDDVAFFNRVLTPAEIKELAAEVGLFNLI